MVDTHCHLDSCEPPDAELIADARALGVGRIATVGMDDASIERSLATAREHEGVVVIAGRHPHKTEGFDHDALARIEAAAGDPLVRAIGETGLDYFRDNAPREDQRRAFEAQLDLAARLELPVVIHTRAAEDDTFAILAERAGEVTVVMHCFSAPDRLEECVERGYMCSFAGNVTYPKSEALQQAARDLPPDRLLVETDSPFLTPQWRRKERNTPANVTLTAEFVADLRGIDYGEIDRLVEENSARVFGW